MYLITLDFFMDPGHGWLKVNLGTFKRFAAKLIEDEAISRYSYMTNNAVFLEEDADMPKFMRHMQEQGVEVEIRDHNSNRDSRIRSYDRYDAERVARL